MGGKGGEQKYSSKSYLITKIDDRREKRRRPSKIHYKPSYYDKSPG